LTRHPIRAGALALALAATFGCNDGAGRASDSASAARAATSAGDACAFVATPAHEDAEALLRDWVKRDADGELLRRGPWIDGAVSCPAREPAVAPVFAIVATYDIDSVVVGDSLAAAFVRWRRVGYVAGAGTNHASFEALPGVVEQQLRARRTPHGWRINSPATRGMILYSAFPVRQALGAGAWPLVEAMAKRVRQSSAPPGGG
jgi:hypothetical protein